MMSINDRKFLSDLSLSLYIKKKKTYQFMDTQKLPSHVYMYEFLTCIQGRRKNDPLMRALKDWVKATTSFRTK